MARSVGITASAVVVLIGSALTILFGAIAALGSFLVRSPLIPNSPVNLGFVIILEFFFALTLGGWGVATGVGLLRAKEWARISMIVFAAFLTLFSLLPALVFAFVPISQDASLPPNFAKTVRTGIIVFYGLLALLGGFWLYFFNTRRVKAQFQGQQSNSAAASASLPGAIPSADRGVPVDARPLSITIIAWFLLIGSAFAPLSLLYSRALFHNAPMPLCFLGFFVFGPTATLILMAWMTAQAIAAIGLLKLKNWARLATIALQCLGILNIVLLVGIPGNRVRYQQIMDAMMASMNTGMAQPISSSFPVSLIMTASLPLFFVILWFLIRRKQAFVKRDLAPIQV